MEPEPPPPQDRAPIRADLQRARAALDRLVAFIRVAIARSGQGPLTRAFIRHMVTAALGPAEALLRRVIYILAEPYIQPARAPANTPKRPPPRVSASTPCQTVRTPCFRLTEPPPRAPRPGLPRNLLPRVLLLIGAPVSAPVIRASDFEARFLRRIEALEYAINDPVREVRRILRRRAARRKPLAPLRTNLPRGAGKHMDTQTQDLVARMTGYATTALAALNDTS